MLKLTCSKNVILLFRTIWRIVDYVLDLVIGYSLLLGWRHERTFAHQWDYRYSAQLVSDLLEHALFKLKGHNIVNVASFPAI